MHKQLPTQLREVFNKNLVHELGQSIKKNHPPFNAEKFENDINNKIDSLSFGDRSSLIADNLKKYLPDNYKEAVIILLQSLGSELQTKEFKGADGFEIMPQCLFISRYGLDNPKTNGKKYPKIFKGTTMQMLPNEKKIFAKHHSLQHRNTRSLYSREHSLQIQINGKVTTEDIFWLKTT